MTDIELTRADVEAILAENNFVRGAPNDDPEKDATHVWVDDAGQRFVRFADKPEDEEGSLVYGDAGRGEAGVVLRYDKAVRVLAGQLSPKKAERFGLQVPQGIFEKALGPAAPPLAIPEGDPALRELGEKSELKQLSGPKKKRSTLEKK